MRCWLLLTCLFLSACTVDSPGPATAGSTSSELAARHQAIAEKAEAVTEAATQLLSETDESRRKVVEGRSTRAEEVPKLRALTAEVERLNTDLQAEVARLETDVLAAGYPQPEPPPEDDTDKR